MKIKINETKTAVGDCMLDFTADKKTYLILATVIFFLASILRFYNLGGTDLWLDEAVYANNSTGSFSEFLNKTRNRNSSPIALPLLYYVFGETIRDPFWIRVPPAIFSIGAVLVLILLPNVGVARRVSIIAAFMCAISSTQVLYGQEVREYSFGVLIGAICLYAFFAYINQDNIWPMAVTAFVAPQVSYGTVFLVAALGIIITWTSFKRGEFFSKILVSMVAFALGCLVTFIVAAKYQIEISSAWYLTGAYPPVDGSMREDLEWLVRSTYGAFAFGLGNFYSVLMLVVAATCFMGLVAGKKLCTWRSEYLAVVALSILLLIQVSAAFLQVYPYGGVRQIIYMYPLLYFCVAVCLSDLILTEAASRPTIMISFVSVLVFATVNMLKIPSVYAEVQNPIALMEAYVSEEDMSNVYAYYGAVPAIEFHIPDFPGVLGSSLRQQTTQIVEEIISAEFPCKMWIISSHDPFGEVSQIVSGLLEKGFTDPQRFSGINATLHRYDNC